MKSIFSGFTMVELLLVMGIFAILIALGSINYFSTYNQTNVGTTSDVLVADLRSAQNKAMSGSAVSSARPTSWGIKFFSDRYVIFPGNSYQEGASDNYEVNIPSGILLSTTFPSDQVRFATGSGEILNYDSSLDTINLVSGSSSEILELNLFGTITSP